MTPHNKAEKGAIAKTVLMPGDPLRAKYIADTYLSDVTCFNEVRNMFGFTGMYEGKKVSVMGSGMGMPSMGIYSYELFNMYDVDNIIRIGSAGAYNDDLKLGDIVFGMGASTDSNFGSMYQLPGTFAPIADFELLLSAYNESLSLGIKPVVGNIVASDIFYNDNPNYNDAWKKMGVLCVDMESAALYMNAARAGKKALTILTISDHIYKDEHMSADERQTSFNNMMKVALNTAKLF